jgi:anti-sigma factor RsiW
MNKDPFFERWRETGWRRKLTPAEKEQLTEWLAGHPDAQSEWAAEANLNELLESLPNVPVPSNFTARVVEAAQHEQAAAQRQKQGLPYFTTGWWLRWLPKAALATVLLGAGLVSYLHLQAERRAEWAESLTTVAQLPSVPNPEVLKDFDAIAALTSTPPADEELLKVMQ